MSKKIKAFPRPRGAAGGQYNEGSSGMDLMDYFAANAPDAPDQWIEDSLGDGHHIVEAICSWRFFYASTMMETRNDY